MGQIVGILGYLKLKRNDSGRSYINLDSHNNILMYTEESRNEMIIHIRINNFSSI